MNYQDKVKDQVPSAFFADGNSARAPIPGTVAEEMPAQNDYWATGKWDGPIGATAFRSTSQGRRTRLAGRRSTWPAAANATPSAARSVTARRRRKGITSKYGLNGVASYHDDRLRKGPMANSSTPLPTARARCSVRLQRRIDDRWRIVMYIRALQRGQNAAADARRPSRPSWTREKARRRLLPPRRPLRTGSQPAPSPAAPTPPSAPSPDSPRTTTAPAPVGICRQPTNPGAAMTTLRLPLSNHERPSPHHPRPAAGAPRPGQFPLSAMFAGCRSSGLIFSVLGALTSIPRSSPIRGFSPFIFSSPSRSAPSSGSRCITRAIPNGRSSCAARGKNPRRFSRVFILLHPLHVARVSRRALEMDGPAHLNDPSSPSAVSISTHCFFTSGSSFTCSISSCAGLYYRNQSVRQDRDGNPVCTRQMHDHSYLALVIFGLLETFLSFDWFMGLDWRWASSLFGVYNFAVCVQASLAAAIVIVAVLRAQRPSPHAEPRALLSHGQAALRLHHFLGLHRLRPVPAHLVRQHSGRDHFLQRPQSRPLDLSHLLPGRGQVHVPGRFICWRRTRRKACARSTFIAVWILFMHGVELYWFIMPYAHMQTMLPELAGFRRLLTVGSILGFAYIRIAAPPRSSPARPAPGRMPDHHELTMSDDPHPHPGSRSPGSSGSLAAFAVFVVIARLFLAHDPGLSRLRTGTRPRPATKCWTKLRADERTRRR